MVGGQLVNEADSSPEEEAEKDIVADDIVADTTTMADAGENVENI